MNDLKGNVNTIIRVLLAATFFVSAIAKIWPDPSAYYSIHKNFDLKQLIPLGFSEYGAMLFSRFIVGAEIALGIALLQRHYLISLIVPLATLMLLIFSFHLGYEIATTGGNEGNCGCFGELIPMTPVESLIKNILAIGLLVFLYFKLESDPKENRIWYLISVYTLSTLLVFSITLGKSKQSDAMIMGNFIGKTYAEFGPEPKKSSYSEVVPYIDNGLQILCFFNPDCDHCKAAGKEMVDVLKNSSMDINVTILFEENNEMVPSFFEFIGKENDCKNYNYQVLDIRKFINVFTFDNEVPGIFILWNGNSIREFQGTEGENSFSKEKFLQEISKIEDEIKSKGSTAVN